MKNTTRMTLIIVLIFLSIVALTTIWSGVYKHKTPQEQPLTNIELTQEQPLKNIEITEEKPIQNTEITREEEYDANEMSTPIHFVFDTKRMKDFEGSEHDKIFITASDKTQTIPISELSGWSVKSTVTQESLYLHDWDDIEVGDWEYIVVIDPTAPTELNHAMEGQVNMYYGQPEVFWNTEGDTIQLLDSAGLVVDTFSF